MGEDGAVDVATDAPNEWSSLACLLTPFPLPGHTSQSISASVKDTAVNGVEVSLFRMFSRRTRYFN